MHRLQWISFIVASAIVTVATADELDGSRGVGLNLDIPWQRVYGWLEESHVRFNHAPHIREGVDCSTCHGDVRQMTVATRAVDHTMEFCVTCHREKKAPDDCLTCHY